MIEEKTISHLVQQAKKDCIDTLLVGAFIMRGKSVLIITRSDSEDFLAGVNEIPSGHVEEQETLTQALIREVQEETALTIKAVIDYVNAFDYESKTGRKNRQLNFLVHVEAGDVVLNPQEHSTFTWACEQDIRNNTPNLTIEIHSCIMGLYNFINNKK